jgi:hypothetical protein
MIDFKWIPHKLRWNNKTTDEVTGNIMVRNPRGDKVELERLKVNDPRVTLGITIALDGTWTGQVKYMKEKANNWVS